MVLNKLGEGHRSKSDSDIEKKLVSILLSLMRGGGKVSANWTGSKQGDVDPKSRLSEGSKTR